MAVRILRLGSPRAKGEGLRIGTVRRPPRGVPRAEFASRDFYDVWPVAEPRAQRGFGSPAAPRGGVRRTRMLLECAGRTPTAAPRSREWVGRPRSFPLRSGGHNSPDIPVPILQEKRLMSVSLFAILSLVLPAEAQQGPPPLVIKPSVAQMVIVDAYVTDRKGRPISDLRQEDFELFEDNRIAVIASFEPPTAVAATPGRESRIQPKNATANPAPEREALTVAIYVDRWLLSGAGRKRALDQAATIAERHLAEGARVVVIAEDKGLRPLTPLTTDFTLVRAALTRIQGWATESPGIAESRNVLEQIESRIELGKAEQCDCVCLLPELVSMVRGYSTFRSIEVQDAANRLAFLVNALGSIPGRKALIYVSEGLEQRPGIQLYDQLGQICPEALHKDASTIYAPMQEFETSTPLREAAARANAARVTFYPIDARGLSTLSGGDVSIANREYVPSAKNDSIKDANLVNQYRLLAEETGGFAMIRGLDPNSAMKRFDADVQGHYILGFVPGDPDGKSHRLRVELNAKAQAKRNAEIRHRQSYFRAEVPARRGQRALSTLLFGLEENALDARVEIQRTSLTAARVQVSVPLSALKPLPGASDGEARVQVVISFRSTQSEQSPVTVREKEVTYSLTAADLRGDGNRRVIVVDVPVGEGAYEFAVGVEDIGSGGAAYLRRPLNAVKE